MLHNVINVFIMHRKYSLQRKMEIADWLKQVCYIVQILTPETYILISLVSIECICAQPI